jgi:biopolymer transport protein ExbD
MYPIGIPLLLAVMWGGLMVFVWRSLPAERRVTKTIVAIVGGLTVLMIFKVGHMLASLVEEDARLAAELDRIPSASAEPQPEPVAGVQEPAIREIVIRVSEAGAFSLDGRPLDDASLEAELMKLKSGNPKMVVTIIADEFAPYQRVIDFLNLCAKARIENVAFEVPEQK